MTGGARRIRRSKHAQLGADMTLPAIHNRMHADQWKTRLVVQFNPPTRAPSRFVVASRTALIQFSQMHIFVTAGAALGGEDLDRAPIVVAAQTTRIRMRTIQPHARQSLMLEFEVGA
jgi:hypothetical protein